ncbi:hypothetical protein ACFFIF_06370 [Vagococcus entomophilus]|uniref:MucBP domain-containing protein n=1 Tax=Vagococcus entomophilus TaxID=1160095 RepID=A0A430AFE9_9ENTE|nr:hypothetical protein [Vagococcus entomophilus]RSU06456.1 hypothetical protein CBF30_09380 [Vagococcus entomophilus]
MCQSGNVAFSGAIDVRNNFEIDGAINLGEVTSNRGYTGIADGIGFVFYKGERNQVVGTGGDLGIYGVTNAFGWKIDTWLNDSKHSKHSKHSNTNQILKGDYDDGHTNPYGTFITTDSKGYGTIDQSSAAEINKAIEDNQFHSIKFIYTAATKKFKIILNTPSGDVTFTKTFEYDASNPAYYFTIAASTGALPTHQAYKIDNMVYSPIQKAIVNYIDDNNGKVLASDSLTGSSSSVIQYATDSQFAFFKAKGYELVRDGFISGSKYDTKDQIFEFHLKHGTTSASENKTITETVHYQYSDKSQAHADQQATPVEFSRTVTTDKVDGTKTYSEWSAKENQTSFAKIVSPTILGYTPDQAEIAEVTGLTAESKSIEKTVMYTVNKEQAKVTYIDDTTGKPITSKELSGDYGTTDGYRTSDTIKELTDQGYN